MSFTTVNYGIFLVVTFIMYWLLPNRHRWKLLLIVSYYFYMSWNLKCGFLIAAVTLLTWAAALGIRHFKKHWEKRVCIISACIVCFGILFVFKYFDFAAGILVGIWKGHYEPLNLILPVGISFFTFQTVGYVIDVYRGDIEAETNLFIYATYVSFFPQLVAGPIERSGNLLPQITGQHIFDNEKATYGLRKMLWGYFKKLVVANTLAVYVDSTFAGLANYNGGALLLISIFFTFQIYCDFSGYSDIAIGTAALFDIQLMENFDKPYLSGSIKEFWQRWHISLSSWLKDYIYIPLGGSRQGKLRTCINTVIVFVASGIWHGANVTFIVWGLLHGVINVIEQFIPAFRVRGGKGVKCIRWLVNFIIIDILWIFFRAQTITDAVFFIGNMFRNFWQPKVYWSGISGVITNMDLMKVVLILTVWGAFSFRELNLCGESSYDRLPKYIRWCCYVMITMSIIILTPSGAGKEFIYFQF